MKRFITTLATLIALVTPAMAQGMHSLTDDVGRNVIYPADAHAELEAAFPGYCDQLTACQDRRLVVTPREEGWATSYVGLTMIAYAVTTVMGTLDFSTGY